MTNVALRENNRWAYLLVGFKAEITLNYKEVMLTTYERDNY